MSDQLQAVIFDFDGVILDSGDFHLRAWQEWAKVAGITKPLTEEWFQSTFGMRNHEIFPDLFERELSPGESEHHNDWKESMFREMARGKLKALPGAQALIEHLHESGIGIAIGTATPSENLEMLLRELHLADFFEVKITAADVKKGKPDPEVFLLGAKGLGIEPKHCVVIEDAAAGIEAANQAGMFSIAVTTTREAEHLAHADLILDSLEEVNLEKMQKAFAEPRI
jgi:beta-phosphoglucomutase